MTTNQGQPMTTDNKIEWREEQRRFMSLAYHRAECAARRAFKTWHFRKREDAIAEMIGKVWATWVYNVEKGKDPVALLGPNIHWAILWVRYDRKLAGRARSFDVEDYRANMTRQDMDCQGKARPSERSARINGWIEWGLSDGDDPAELVAALEAVGLTCAAYAA